MGLGGGHLSRGNVVWGAVSSKSGGLDSVGGIEVVDLSKKSELRWGFCRFLRKLSGIQKKIVFLCQKSSV